MLMHVWRMLLRQEMPLALSFARPSAGSNMLARIAMIAITTSNSISVKPRPIRCEANRGLSWLLEYPVVVME
jgi:hypothetical protein